LASPSTKLDRRWTPVATTSTPDRSERVEYKIRLDWFDSDGMVYGFDLIDPENRMLVHAFRFQVFYHPDEQTLLVTRGAHVAAEGM
jgi:hypothetical protein